MSAQPRNVDAIIKYNGKEIDLDVTDISYTDNAEGNADDISLTIHSSPRDTFFVPEKESDVSVTMYFNRWKRQGSMPQRYHCGTFVLDDISYSGSPNTLQLNAVAQPAGEGFTTVKRSRTWENITLKGITEAIIAQYGIERSLYYYAPDINIPSIEQNDETDSSFLKTICDKYDLCIKMYKTILIVFSWEIFEQIFGACEEFTIEDMDSFQWNTTVNGTYTGAHLKYTTKATSKKAAQTIEVTVGTGPRMLELTDKVESETEARELARQKVNAENMKATTLSFSLMANPMIYASYKIRIVNSGRMNGEYMVTKVTHSLSSTSGESSTIECYKRFARL